MRLLPSAVLLLGCCMCTAVASRLLISCEPTNDLWQVLPMAALNATRYPSPESAVSAAGSGDTTGARGLPSSDRAPACSLRPRTRA